MMAYEDLIQDSLGVSTAILQKSAKQLTEYCEADPRVREFVETVLDFTRTPPGEASSVGFFLRTLLWEIAKVDISDNPFHGVATLYELRSFIGNYFMDDSYFVLYEEGKLMRAKSSQDDEHDTQDPRALLAAAQHNREYYVARHIAIRKRLHG
ncbi:MAG: hypothetical protein EOO40_11595 [Deltaproteobacteria bacterium]|nr:MAG: hypothetical protein EOO40_11595 [Deltaproteobacteria bacterium]